MVGKVRSGKRQCTLKCAFKPQNKNLPKDGVSNRNTSSCLWETINVGPYLSSGIVLQPHQNCTSIEWHDHPSYNMRFPGWSPNMHFFSTKSANFKIYSHIAYPPWFSHNTHGRLIGIRNRSIMWKHYVRVHAGKRYMKYVGTLSLQIPLCTKFCISLQYIQNSQIELGNYKGSGFGV
jgi:hypothetical protein